MLKAKNMATRKFDVSIYEKGVKTNVYTVVDSEDVYLLDDYNNIIYVPSDLYDELFKNSSLATYLKSNSIPKISDIDITIK